MKTLRILAALLLLSSPVMAQDRTAGPLPAGKPAGVKQASGAEDEAPWLIVTAVVSLVGGFLIFHHKTAAAAASPAPTTTS